MQTKVMEKYFFFALLFGTLFFTSLIFRPFWTVLILGISFSIVLYPIFSLLLSLRLSRWLSSLITVFLFTVILLGPLLGLGIIVFNQTQDLYTKVVYNRNLEPFLESITETINKILPEGVEFNAQDRATDFVTFLSSHITTIFTNTLSTIFSFLLMLLIIFYFLKDGERWRKAVIILSPLSDRDDEKIIDRLSQAVNVVIKGSLLIGFIQGILMGIGLWIFNVPNPALWGVVAAVASLLPTIGTSLVSVPAIIYLFAIGDNVSALGLLIWAAILVGMIDNLLSPIIVGGKTNIPSLLILFSVLGGISLMGPVGILVGPLTISLLYTLISIYRNEFQKNVSL